jgi:hypothetical protein
MRFHLPSFFVGFAAGATTVLVGRELKPVAVEGAASVYQLWDALWARAAMLGEDIEDILTEARARADSSRSKPAENASKVPNPIRGKQSLRSTASGEIRAVRTTRAKSRPLSPEA